MVALTYNGLDINTGSKNPYSIASIEGLRGFGVRSGDSPIPRASGDTPGDHYLSSKNPVLSIRAIGRYDEIIPQLLDAFRPQRNQELPLEWEENGEKRILFCRTIDAPIVHERNLDPAAFDVTIGLKASDPRVYGEDHKINATSFVLSGGAVNEPINEPKNATEEGGNYKSAFNNGDSDAHPTITVFGPDSNTIERFEVINETNGSRVDISASIGSDQSLIVRMREFVTRRLDKRIIELSGANRYNSWENKGEIFYLSPGDNVIRFDVTSGNETGAKMVMSWQDTFDGMVR